MARILIVDDEAETLTLLRFMLERDGHEVVEAKNGKIALEMLGVDPAKEAAPLPDLIILDIMMPVLDGYATNASLQADERTRGIPVVVLTARGQSMRDLFEVASNVASYLQKPFDPKTLRELVAKIIAKAKTPKTHG